jgi:hypothetical protein
MFIEYCIVDGTVVEAKKGKACPADSAFYGIDPSMRPILPYTYVIVVEANKVYQQYDVLSPAPKGAIQFITWIEPVPHTTPLFIFENKKENRAYVSFSEKPPSDGYDQIEMSPIYVLTKAKLPRTVKGVSRTKSGSDDTYFPDPPRFLFQVYMNRIIPDVNGIPIYLIEKRIKPYALREVLEKEYAQRQRLRLLALVPLVIILFLAIYKWLVRDSR